MAVGLPSQRPTRIVIAGGGFAAVEALLALRVLAGDRVELTLISPDPLLRDRPGTVSDAFEEGLPQGFDLPAIAHDLGATYRKDRLQAVASRKRYVRTGAGARLEYEALILAIGSRAVSGVPGALTVRDQRDLRLVRKLLAELEAGVVRRLVFAVPGGCSWPLPLYELALLAATRMREQSVEVELSFVTPEHAPLEPFGVGASQLVARLLDEKGVRFVGGTVATSASRDGSVTLAFRGAIPADRVVALPELRGTRITGVPASWWGFVPTDAHGRVEGLHDVYAAGDMTTFPIKHGSLATQQADRVAHTIAERLALPVKEFRAGNVLKARLVGGPRPVYLRTELDSYGQPISAELEQPEEDEQRFSTKVFGRYLTPYLDTRQPLAAGEAAAA